MNMNDTTEDDDKRALLCVDAVTMASIKPAIQELGYKVVTADSSEHAIESMRYNASDLIVLHENFTGATLESNNVLHYLASLPMAQKRYSFTCLVGPSLITLDAMQAFAHSVHMVIHPIDLANFQGLIRKGVREMLDLYQEFRRPRRRTDEA